ncbi:MAG: lysylphosphatidylglycerol synthase transmembrane domain-containing protein [Pseudomonadota bacterium]
MNRAMALRIAFFVPLLAMLAWHYTHNPNDYSFLQELQGKYLAPLVLLSIGQLLLEALRFSFTANTVWGRLTVSQAFAFLVFSRLLNRIVPQSGLLYKVRMLQKQQDSSFGRVVLIFGSMAWMQLCFTLLIAIALLLGREPALEVAGVSVLFILITVQLLLIGGTILAGIVPIKRFAEIERLNRRLRRVLKAVSNAVEGLTQLISAPRLLVLSALAIASSILLGVTRLVLCFMMLGYSLDFDEGAVFIAINRLLNVTTLTPGNVGITELAYGGLAHGVGFGVAAGVTAALLIRILSFLTLSLCGGTIALLRPELATEISADEELAAPD